MKLNLIVFLVVFHFLNLDAQTRLTLNTDSVGIKISPSLYGIFFEDINHAADGGIYAELISNRSFEDNASTPDNWTLIKTGSAAGTITLENTQLLNSAQSYSLKIQATAASPTAKLGTANAGYWGINVVNGRHYTLNFFAKANTGFTGKITVNLQNNTGTVNYATNVINGITDQWKKYTCDMVAAGGTPQGRFAITMDTIGTVWLDVVSLFPPTYKNRENGFRPDLMQMLIDLKPKFYRFPGGCFVEGNYLADRYQWKTSIGSIENRVGLNNNWGYRASNGLGFHEYLQMAEDLGAEPLFVVNIGIAHNDMVNYLQINPYVQEALDAIEYANGAVTTTYGAMRAANGHPEPFNLKYIEIGNENNQFNDNRSDHYAERYQTFYTAIKTKYPEIKCIGNVEAWGTDNPSWKTGKATDFVDEHYYRDPQWFIANYNKYDSYSRSGPKVYVGEYAVTSGCGNGNLIAAIGEAAYMAGMEKNSDIVQMCSYAPIFVNTNNRAWNPDMIVYNSAQSYGTPSYYIQKLFANNIGDVDIPVKEKLNIISPKPVTGTIGLGSWATQVQYDSIVVAKGNTTIINEQFTNATNWAALSGTWAINSGVYAQTSTSTDCRSIYLQTISDSSYTYTLKAKKTGGNEGFLIIFGYQNSTNFYWWNIGGWGNTQHAIEKCVNGTKSAVSTSTGNIVLNKWYNLKIEVKYNTVNCYIDGVLINSFTNPDTRILYTSASKNTSTNEIILKVINPSDKANTTKVSLFDNKKDTLVNGTISVLTSTSATAENSFASPMLIAPVVTAISDSSTFTHTFPAYSVTVFNVKLSGSGITSNPSKKKDQNEVIVYPNPINKDGFTIEFPEKERNKTVKLAILNSAGQIVYKKSFVSDAQNYFAVPQLKNGSYNLTILGTTKMVTQKIIKMGE